MKFMAGVLVTTLVALAMGWSIRSRTPTQVPSESITEEVQLSLENAGKALFDPDALKNHGVFLHHNGGGGKIVSGGLLVHIVGESLTTGRLVETTGENEDSRAVLLSRVQEPVLTQSEQHCPALGGLT